MSLVSGHHMGPLWTCLYGLVCLRPTWVFSGLTHIFIPHCPLWTAIWDCQYVTHMGPIRAWPYRQAIIHPIQGPIGLAILSHMGHLWAWTYGSYPIWGCPYGKHVYIPHLVHMGMLSGPLMGQLLACLYALARRGPILVLYGAAHMGLAVWDHHTWGHIDLLSGPYMGPLGAAHMGLAVWDPYGSYKGVPIWASSDTSHIRPIWACYLGPTTVLYGSAHMGLTVWDLYGLYMGVPIWATRIHPKLSPYGIWAPHG